MRGIVPFACSIALFAASCGPGVSSCVPGATASCACLGGPVGVQECREDGTFDACRCPAPGEDGGSPLDAGTEVDSGADIDAHVPVDSGSIGVDASTIRGHVVIIGHYVWTADDAWDRIFANAIFLSERAGDLRVVEYTEYSAGSGWEGHPRDVMEEAAADRGRTLVRTALTTASGLGAALASADVLFVPVQITATESAMQTVAGFWHDDLVAFVEDGGVVVVLSAETGGNGGHEYHLVEGADLFTFGGRSGVGTGGSPPVAISIVDPTDPVALGVVSPFPTPSGSGSACFPSSARGNLVARTDTTLCPVVRHLVR